MELAQNHDNEMDAAFAPLLASRDNRSCPGHCAERARRHRLPLSDAARAEKAGWGSLKGLQVLAAVRQTGLIPSPAGRPSAPGAHRRKECVNPLSREACALRRPEAYRSRYFTGWNCGSILPKVAHVFDRTVRHNPVGRLLSLVWQRRVT